MPGSLDKRDFELTSSAGYALIVVAIAIAMLLVGLAVTIVLLLAIKYVLVLPYFHVERCAMF